MKHKTRGVDMAKKSSKKKLTPMQQAFKKEQKRIKSLIKRAEKRGYKFEENLIPDLPKRVTKKALEEIKRLKPDRLYKHSISWIDGQQVSGKKKRTIERKKSAEKARITREMRKTFYTGDVETQDYIPILSPENVIGSYLQTLSNFPNGTGAHLIRKWFSEVMNNLINKYGKDIANQLMATAIEDATNSGYVVDNHIAYSATHATHHIYGVLQFIPELGTLEKEQFSDILETMEEFTI